MSVHKIDYVINSVHLSMKNIYTMQKIWSKFGEGSTQVRIESENEQSVYKIQHFLNFSHNVMLLVKMDVWINTFAEG